MPRTPLRTPHATWPGLLPWQTVFCAWVLGLLAWQWPIPAGTALALFLWAWVGASSEDQGCQRMWPRLTAGALAFALGLLTVHLVHPPPRADPLQRERIAQHHRQPSRVTATIAEVRPRPGQRLQIILQDVTLNRDGHEPLNLHGKLLWNWQHPAILPQPGQRVQAALRVKPIQGMANPGLSRSEDYWARQGVYYRAYAQGSPKDFTLSSRTKQQQPARAGLRARLLAHTPEGQGQAMLLALLMGDRFLLAPETMDLVQRASLAHSLALSGLHLGFVVGLGWLLARACGWIAPGIYLRLPRPKLAVLISAPLVLGYLWLGQAVPSLLRAALMFASWGLLLLLGRRRVLIDGLFLALVVILALSPLAVFDLRLQLSALAVAGLALVWPLGRDLLVSKHRPWWQGPGIAALGILAVSCVATLALLPLQAWYFGRISPHLYLNVLWLPLLGLVVFPLGIMGLVLVIIPGATPVAGLLLGAACAVLDAMLAALQAWDAAGLLTIFIPARPLWPQFIGYWATLLAAAAWWTKPQKLRPAIVAAALVLLVLPLLVNLAQEQRPGVSLWLLDVGQGQAVLVESGRGKRWLVDGGGSWTRDFDLGRVVVAPTLTHGRPPRLSGVFLSHADFDHYRGLFHLLRHFAVDAFLSQGRGPKGEEGAELATILQARSIPHDVLRAGDRIRLDHDLVLEVLHPDDAWINADKDNNACLVLRLLWRGRPLALLPGDVELPAIAAVLQGDRDLAADILIIPHHGSRTSFSPSLYDQVDPALALVSSGYLNYFNHPHPEVTEALQERGVRLLNTGDHGAITVRWKSPRAAFEVQTQR